MLRHGDATIELDEQALVARHWHPSGSRTVSLTPDQAKELRQIIESAAQPYAAPYDPFTAAMLRLEEWWWEQQEWDWRAMLLHLRCRPPYAGRGGLRNLAKDLGVFYETVRSWSQGRRAPGADNRVRIEQIARAAHEKLSREA